MSAEYQREALLQLENFAVISRFSAVVGHALRRGCMCCYEVPEETTLQWEQRLGVQLLALGA